MTAVRRRSAAAVAALSALAVVVLAPSAASADLVTPSSLAPADGAAIDARKGVTLKAEPDRAAEAFVPAALFRNAWQFLAASRPVAKIADAKR